MRYLSLCLPTLPTDRIRKRWEAAPGDRPEAGPLATVAKVKGAHRLAALDARAAALGLRPGTALADARAMHPQLALRDAEPEADAATLAAIIDWCRAFTPLAAPDGEDGAILDITGAAHLFGGERALMATVAARLARQGFAASVAVAGTPGAAWALNRYGGTKRLIPDAVEPVHLARLFAPMPLAALRLEGSIIARLAQAGLRCIGDLLLRPRAPVAARFGPDVHRRLDGLLGQARQPISPRFAAPAFLAERRFAEGVAQVTDVQATILALAYDLCGLLTRHGEGARRLDVSLYRVDGVVKHLVAGTSRPLRDPLAMARLFRERIEAVGEDGLDSGYGFDVVRLAALSAERLDPDQLEWGETESGDLADLVDRLGARFGLARVVRLRDTDGHRPGQVMINAVAVPAVHRAMNRATNRAMDRVADRSGRPFLPPPAERLEGFELLPERPIRLLDRPEPIEAIAAVPDGPPMRFTWRRVTHHVAAIEGPERIGPDWWRQGRDGSSQASSRLSSQVSSQASSDASSRTRDYFRAEDTEGRRFWLYREGLYHQAPAPRWYLHGFFA